MSGRFPAARGSLRSLRKPGRLLMAVAAGLAVLFILVWWFWQVPVPAADHEPANVHLHGVTHRAAGDLPAQSQPETSPPLPVAATPAENPKFDPHDVLSWGGTGRNWFACMLEKQGYPSGRWGCQTPPWQGDPCRDEFLYTGPAFPDAMAVQLSPLIDHVELKWDAGRIVRWEIGIKPGSSEDDVRRDLRLPAGVPSDLVSVEFRKCPEADLCLVVKAADRINCPGHRSEEE